MKNKNTDSTANVSRFARDKRQRVSSTERVERTPRPRREADSEAGREFRTPAAKTEKRTSYNPHFTADNRLRPEYEQRPRRNEDGDRPARSFNRTERGERSFNREERGGDRGFGRGERTERPARAFNRDERNNERPARTFNREERNNERPARSFNRDERNSDRGFGRGERTERPARNFNREERNNDRPARTFNREERGERTERPARSFNRDERSNDRGFKGGAKRTGAPKRDEKPRSYPKFNPNQSTGEIRLNRFISQSGVCSRREADDFILAGVVTVNGQVVTELGTKILPTDEVRFHDEKLQGEKNVYLVLNKPKGYVTSLDDPHAEKTVMDLVKNACTERVYPVGRLDKNSLGLLLITNDGDITRQLTHPSYRKKKIYQVTLDKALTRADMDSLTEGITLEDGDIFADEVAYASEDKRTVGVEIHSGRNRIVRRMFEHLGYTVQKLDRVYYAGLTKKNLKRGEWRFLTRDEVMRLKTGQYE
ncbi:MAG: pseudouridine synthase [Alistipes sp.]|nr:pseudouridine synthase [Alistipes sp.]MBR5770953.1 pseudouridine synthase [Alistipes sp.]